MQYVSWNARALCHYAAAAADRRLRVLTSLAGPQAVVSLQETHGSRDTVAESCQRAGVTHHFFSSYEEGSYSGRVATLVPSGPWAAQNLQIVPAEVYRGRVLMLKITSPTFCLFHWNVHNFDIPSEVLRGIQERVQSQIEAVRANPLGVGIILHDDFNIANESGGSCRQGRAGDRVWKQIFRKLTELATDAPTCWHQGTRTEACVDRFFTATPPWLLCEGYQTAVRFDEPRELFLRDVSDHCPVTVTMHGKPQARESPRPRPLPRMVVSDPLFPKLVAEYENLIEFERLEAPAALELATLCRQAAARATRDLVLARDSRAMMSRAMVSRTLARCVSRQDARLARAVLARHRWTRDHLAVNALGEVWLLDPSAFQDLHCSLQLQERRAFQQRLEAEARGEPRPGMQQRIRARRAAQVRRARLWCPLGRRKYLTAVTGAGTGGAESVTSPPEGMARALNQHRAPIFGKATPLPKPAARYTRKFCNSSFDLRDLPPPALHAVSGYLLRASSSAPGPDGLPFAAWRHGKGPKILHQVLSWVMAGRLMPPEFGAALQVFIPKPLPGDDPSQDGPVRAGADVRPLGLKNRSNKTVAAVLNRSLTSAVQVLAAPSQRGGGPREFLSTTLLT